MHQDERTQTPLKPIDFLHLLKTGEMEVLGRMPRSSNATLLVKITNADAGRDDAQDEQPPTEVHGIYKPGKGERPLWDFPDGLYRREVAAWELSEMLGWGLVPETVLREGPFGEGSVQRFIEADFEQHYFTLYEDPTHHEALRMMCAFDLLINNTDRKSGHCLLGHNQRIYGIDNGLCFHPDPKIRTVIWEFGGEPIPTAIIDDIARLIEEPPGPLARYLSDDEIAGIKRRGSFLIERRVFPQADPDGRCYPWPLI